MILRDLGLTCHLFLVLVSAPAKDASANLALDDAELGPDESGLD